MRRRRGLTLAELVVVLVVLVALAGLMVPLLSSQAEDAREKVTRANLVMLRDLLLGNYRADNKDDLLFQFESLGPSATDHRPLVLPRARFDSVTLNTPKLKYLFLNPGLFEDTGAVIVSGTTADTVYTNSSRSSYRPATHRGWRGPYLAATGTYNVDNSTGFTSDYGDNGDPTVVDGWGKPILVVERLDGSSLVGELRSAGPNGILWDGDDVVGKVETKP